MRYEIYKPNKSNTGFCFGFQVSLDPEAYYKPTLWVQAIRQFNTNSNSRGAGTFSGNKDVPGKSINCKFTIQEIGGLVRALKTRGDYNCYHDSPAGKVQISLKYAETPNPRNPEIVHKGFFFTISKEGEAPYKSSLKLEDESYALAAFLEAQAFVAPAVMDNLELKVRAEKAARQSNAREEADPFSVPNNDAEPEVEDVVEDSPF